MIKCCGGHSAKVNLMPWVCPHSTVTWPAHPSPCLCPEKEAIGKFAVGLCDFIFCVWCVCVSVLFPFLQSKNQVHRRGEYNVYSTFQSHEPEFDYLKSLEIEEKINKIRWLPQQNAAYFLLSTNGTWRWLCLFGICRDAVSKPHISIFPGLSFSFYLVSYLNNLETIFARCLPECLA